MFLVNSATTAVVVDASGASSGGAVVGMEVGGAVVGGTVVVTTVVVVVSVVVVDSVVVVASVVVVELSVVSGSLGSSGALVVDSGVGQLTRGVDSHPWSWAPVGTADDIDATTRAMRARIRRSRDTGPRRRRKGFRP